MSVVQIRIVSCCALGFIAGLGLLPCVDTSAQFTRFSPSVLYVSSGGAARFVWDYNVDNRVQEFSIESPVWYFYDKSSNVYITIGVDDRFTNNWDFVINRATCPPRLLNPDRVSRELPATLVISAVTTADNGKYRCSLMLKSGNNVKSQVQLVVTVTPAFLPSYPNKIYHIIEGQDLKINCTGIGPPAPNITWVNITDGKLYSKTQGSGSAVLSIDNIQRHHAGVYECQAKNNPNENAATTRTAVTVYYKPNIAKELSTNNYNSWHGRQVTLKCIADGLPTPQITWYKPSGEPITTDVTTITNGSHQTITTEDRSDYGSYKCLAVNVAGRDEYVINVTQLFKPGAPNVTIFEGEIQASSVTVRWTKPGYDGGSPVIDYKVQINTTQLQKKSTSQTEHGFRVLTKNTKYDITVYARNVVGFGNASIITFTTKKKGAPHLPKLHLSKSATSITLSWTKPDQNGGEINNYTIYQKQGEENNQWASIYVVLDLLNLKYEIKSKDLESGQNYWFIVTASNEFGESAIGDDKGAEVYIEPKISTATPTATTSRSSDSSGETKDQSGKQDKCSLTDLAIFITLFLISLVFNIILLLYIWRMRKIKEQNGNTDSKSISTTKQKAVEDPVYDNALEMEENQVSRDPTSNISNPTFPVGDYEPIRPRNYQPIVVTKNVDDHNTSVGKPSHYEALTDSHISELAHRSPTYEPLRHQESTQPDVQHHINAPNPTYQPLGIMQNPSNYQSLQTYNNMHQLQSNTNDQSII